jgi:RND superfamily putative drug exporter
MTNDAVLTHQRIRRIARWSATHPRRAIGLWLLFVAGCLVAGGAAGLRTSNALDSSYGQSGTSAHILDDAGMTDPATENILIEPAPGRPADHALAAAAGQQISQQLAKLPQVTSVAPARTSARGDVLIVASMRGDAYTANERVGALLNVTSDVAHGYPQLRIDETGAASIQKAIDKQVSSDLGSAAAYSLPVTLLILLIGFGALTAAGVSILLALSAIGSAIGLSELVSHVVPASSTTSSVILLIGMAVGVDYSLFYVKRAREERRRGATHHDAVELAAATSGHSVVVSGLAVVLAMLGLLAARDTTFSSFAVGSLLVVGIAVAGSLTVLPAVLSALGPRIDRPRVPLVWRWTVRDRPPRIIPRLLRPALRHPAVVFAGSTVGLLLLASPLLDLHLHADSEATLPRSIPITASLARLAVAFPDRQTTHDIVVDATASDAVPVTAALRTLRTRISSDPRFPATSTAPSPIRASADGSVHELQVSAPYDAESAAAKWQVHLLREQILPRALLPAGARWAVGGDTATDVDYDHHLSVSTPLVITIVVLANTLLIGAVFRSLGLALVTALLNLLSIAATLGVLVLIFQHSWATHLLGFHSTGSLISWIPLFTFAVLFSLSMDYHVFVVSRIQEARRNGLPTVEAVRQGIIGSAGAISSAAVVMVSVFVIFAAQHLVDMKEFGVGLAVAVPIDALVVRALALPSMLVLLDRFTGNPRPTQAAALPPNDSRKAVPA